MTYRRVFYQHLVPPGLTLTAIQPTAITAPTPWLNPEYVKKTAASGIRTPLLRYD